MTKLNDEATLKEAQEYVERGRVKGVACPCCNQYAKDYRRQVNRAMARFLLWLVEEFEAREDKDAWISVNDGPLIQHRRGGGDFAKLAHWGLIEQMPNDDANKRTSGFWRPTQKGIDFAHDRITIEKYLTLYNNEVLAVSKEMVSIRDALGKNFNYAELMQKEVVGDSPSQGHLDLG